MINKIKNFDNDLETTKINPGNSRTEKYHEWN